MTSASISISQAPRENRKRPSSDRLLRATMRPALVPARNTKVGAQKCVIHRVTKSAAPMSGFAAGSSSPADMKKSRE